MVLWTAVMLIGLEIREFEPLQTPVSKFQIAISSPSHRQPRPQTDKAQTERTTICGTNRSVNSQLWKLRWRASVVAKAIKIHSRHHRFVGRVILPPVE
jgi:hypothetical protein